MIIIDPEKYLKLYLCGLASNYSNGEKMFPPEFVASPYNRGY